MPKLRQSWISGDIFTSPDRPQTLAAWQPYHLCTGIHFDFQNSDIEPLWGHWQVQWIAGIALLRSTGHVLYKVDSKSTERHRRIIREIWAEWQSDRKKHWVFWEFIEKDRNNILKEFNLNFKTGPYLEPNEYDIEKIVYNKLWKFREAVYWWRAQLRTLEEQL
jgi:hypothetical protein